MARPVTSVEDQLRRLLSHALGARRYCDGISYVGFLLRMEGDVVQRVRHALACLVTGSRDVDDLRAGARRIAVSWGSSDCYVVLSVWINSASGFGLVFSSLRGLPRGALRGDQYQHDPSVH